MTIIQCKSCQTQLRVADDCAGQQGQCPRCKAIFVVPAPVPREAQQASAATGNGSPLAGPAVSERCPNCQLPWLAGATLCVSCGFNLATGQVTPSDVDAVERRARASRIARPQRRWFLEPGGGESPITKVLRVIVIIVLYPFVLKTVLLPTASNAQGDITLGGMLGLVIVHILLLVGFIRVLRK